MAPLNIVLGCMTYGAEQKSRVSDVGTIQGIFDVFKQYGHNEMDTSRVYAAGTSEQILGELAVQSKQGMKMATKCHPRAGGIPLENGYPHTKQGLAKSMAESLQALQVGQVDIFLLHMPVRTNGNEHGLSVTKDRSVPYDETCEVVNELHKQGKFIEVRE